MARKVIKFVISNPEAIEEASKRFTKAVYEAYMESLLKIEKIVIDTNKRL